MSAHRFRVDQDVAVVEPGLATEPIAACVVEVRPWSVAARYGDGCARLFLIDSRGRAWRESGRQRLVALCYGCGEPVTGLPVLADGDLEHREWCSAVCLKESAEALFEQRNPSGVAT